MQNRTVFHTVFGSRIRRPDRDVEYNLGNSTAIFIRVGGLFFFSTGCYDGSHLQSGGNRLILGFFSLNAF